MHLPTSFFALVTAIAVAHAQSPACELPCINAAFANTPSCSVGNYSCACYAHTFSSQFDACIANGTCPEVDMLTATNDYVALCNAVPAPGDPILTEYVTSTVTATVAGPTGSGVGWAVVSAMTTGTIGGGFGVGAASSMLMGSTGKSAAAATATAAPKSGGVVVSAGGGVVAGAVGVALGVVVGV